MAEFINTIDVLGDDAVIDSIIDRTITEFKDDKVTEVGQHAFYNCSALTSVELPKVTSLGHHAFQGCTNLIEVDLPLFSLATNQVSTFYAQFHSCSNLSKANVPLLTVFPVDLFNSCGFETVNYPQVTELKKQVFLGCKLLRVADFASVTSIDSMCFYKCNALNALILRSETLCKLLNSDAFTSSSIASGTGYIYVPRALVEDYKAATNWSTYATQFRALEDYTVDGTTSGKFAAGVIHYNLQFVSSSNTETFVIGSYRTTLAVSGNNPFVSVTMDGVDITTDVYNSETHEIVIPQVVGGVVITATAEFDMDASTIYNLPAPTTFNGTSDYIDTGIKLFDTPKDFTIVCSADFSALGSNICLLHCMNEASPYPGLCVDGTSGVRICYTGASALNSSIMNKNNVSALALRYKAGVLDAIRYKDVSGNIVTVAHNTATTYRAITQNLLLGAYQTTAGTKGRYYKGTIKSFVVFGGSLADDLITDMLQIA